MFRSTLAAALLLASTAVHAADATAPVNEVMAAVQSNWTEMGSDTDTPPDYVDYFSDDFLGRLYSKDFVAKYREAAKYPAYDDGGSPFSYDVIAMGQDGCPLKDIKTTPAAASGGKVPVTVTFDNFSCFEDAPKDLKPSRVTFETIEEDGKAVIDDIIRHYEDGDQSLKAEMADIVKFGAEGGAEGEQPEEQPEGTAQ